MKKYDDMLEAMGGGDAPPSDDDKEPDAGKDDLPPEFVAAYDEYEKSPSAQTMYDMIEACSGGKHGLAIVIGKGK